MPLENRREVLRALAMAADGVTLLSKLAAGPKNPIVILSALADELSPENVRRGQPGGCLGATGYE